MKKYAKFINENEIEVAPINKGAISNYNLDIDLMLKDGYKPVVVIEEQSDEKPLIRYEEKKDCIEQSALELPKPEPHIPTKEEKEIQVRSVRNSILNYTDKYMLIDFPISEEEKGKYIRYRQYLRDYTKIEEWWESNPKTYEEFEN